MSLEIKPATVADLPLVLEILDEISAWGNPGGIVQWPLPWPAEYISEIIDSGEMFLAYRDGQPVATFALRSSDEEVWGQQPPDAFYVRHLGVRRSQNGKGLGRWLLEWSTNFARSHGKEFLRLDCIASNSFLQDYYRRAGFTHVGYHTLALDRGMICLFERELGEPPGE